MNNKIYYYNCQQELPGVALAELLEVNTVDLNILLLREMGIV